MNVVDAILFQARHHPAQAALCAPGNDLGLLSYGRLANSISTVGHLVRARGISPGDVVATYIADPIFHAVIILALTHIGAVTLSARETTFAPELGVKAVISDRNIVFGPDRQVIQADISWLSSPVMEDSPRVDTATEADDPCRIILTSGTTGQARAVLFSHNMVLQRVLRQHMMLGSAAAHCARVFIDFGMSSSLGFMTLIGVLGRGGTLYFRGADAADTMQAFGLYNVGCMLAAPNGLAEFLTYYESSPGFISPFKVIVTAGSLLARGLSERIRSRLCSNVVSLYGSTEASIVATAPAHVVAERDGAVGYLAPGIEVQTADGKDAVLPLGAEGRVRIRGAGVAKGYLGTAVSDEPFRNGWFYPGDYGVVTADNMLIITGREKTIINLGGNKVRPERIETVVAACPGVSQVAAFGQTNASGIEEILVAIVAHSSLRDERLRDHCLTHLGPDFLPRAFIRTDAIPRNAAGKIDRARLAELRPDPPPNGAA